VSSAASCAVAGTWRVSCASAGRLRHAAAGHVASFGSRAPPPYQLHDAPSSSSITLSRDPWLSSRSSAASPKRRK